VGYLLQWVVDLRSPWLVAGVVAVMLAVAGHAAVGRSSRTLAGLVWLAMASLVVSGLATVYAVTAVVVGSEPWWEPRYLIPLLGMILGNSLTGISLGVDSLLESFDAGRETIETDLALGATRWEAALPAIREAVRRAMIPMINSMLVVGLVSLPGMMTGQILQGADPAQAVKYQIVVMFMIAAATSLGSIGIALLTFRRLFNAKHQLVSDCIKPRRSRR